MYTNLSEETISTLVFDDLTEFLSRPEDYYSFIFSIIESGSKRVKSCIRHVILDGEDNE